MWGGEGGIIPSGKAILLFSPTDNEGSLVAGARVASYTGDSYTEGAIIS